jgi:hypothetical protein
VPQNNPLTPAERSLRAQIAAEESWAHTDDPPARTANARRAFLDKFEQQVDPNNELSPAERAKRAEHKRRAHFKRMALKSAQARRRRNDARQAAVQTRLAELDGGDAA